jgi:hypothetical protein
MQMSDYMFRGKPITGAMAYVLFDSIQRVLEEAPNPTDEDMKVLSEIMTDWDEKIEEEFQQEIQDHEENSLEGLDRDK